MFTVHTGGWGSYLLRVAAAAAGRAGAPGGGSRVLRRGPSRGVGRVPPEEDVPGEAAARGRRGERRRRRGGCWGVRVARAGRCSLGHSGPQGRVPGARVEHGGGGRGGRELLDLQLAGIIIPGVLFDLYSGKLDLLPGLRDGGAEVHRLGRCCYTGYLADVLGRSEGIPVFGLAELPSLRVGPPVVGGHRWEREEGLRGRDATERGFVVEEARVRQDAVRELEGRGGTRVFLTHVLHASVGPAVVERLTLAPGTLRPLRHLQSSAAKTTNSAAHPLPVYAQTGEKLLQKSLCV